jgi:hypothetical protein
MIYSVLQTTNSNKKNIIERKNIESSTLYVPWAFANETLLLSSLQSSANSSTTYICDSIQQVAPYLQKNDIYLNAPFYLACNLKYLNAHYFKLPNSNYQLINRNLFEVDTLNMNSLNKLDITPAKENYNDSLKALTFSDEFIPLIDLPVKALKCSSNMLNIKALAMFKIINPTPDDKIFLVLDIDNGKIYYTVNETSVENSWYILNMSKKIEYISDYKQIKCFIWNKSKSKLAVQSFECKTK